MMKYSWHYWCSKTYCNDKSPLNVISSQALDIFASFYWLIRTIWNLLKHALSVSWFLLRCRSGVETQRAAPCCFLAGAIVVTRLVGWERGRSKPGREGGRSQAEGLYLPKADLLWSVLIETLILSSTDTSCKFAPWEMFFKSLKDISQRLFGRIEQLFSFSGTKCGL